MTRTRIVRAPIAALLLTTAALLMSTAASAQPGRPDALPLTVDEAVRRAVENNPDLAIVRLDTEVAPRSSGKASARMRPSSPPSWADPAT